MLRGGGSPLVPPPLPSLQPEVAAARADGRPSRVSSLDRLASYLLPEEPTSWAETAGRQYQEELEFSWNLQAAAWAAGGRLVRLAGPGATVASVRWAASSQGGSRGRMFQWALRELKQQLLLVTSSTPAPAPARTPPVPHGHEHGHGAVVPAAAAAAQPADEDKT